MLKHLLPWVADRVELNILQASGGPIRVAPKDWGDAHKMLSTADW